MSIRRRIREYLGEDMYREEPVKIELLYLEVNGRRFGRSPLDTQEKKLVAEWGGEWTEYGKWQYELYEIPYLGLVLRMLWHPQYGYTWSEERVYRLIIPRELGQETPFE